MSYRFLSKETRAKLKAASERGHIARWAKSHAEREARRVLIRSTYDALGQNAAKVAEALNLHPQAVWRALRSRSLPSPPV